MTGSFGSGCTKTAKDFLVPSGYEFLSLSDLLRAEYEKEHANGTPIRDQLQDFGNKMRQDKGPDYLSKLAFEIMEQKNGQKKWVIDSIRNTHEVEFFRKKIPGFFLIGVFADYNTRWERVKDHIYKGDLKKFREHDKRDIGEEFDYGQKVRQCFMSSDLIISNNIDYYDGNVDYNTQKRKFDKYIRLFENPYSDLPTDMEAIMASAYANAQRSSCLKRKVGAVIVDNFGNLFSSGYNDVPRGELTCEEKYTTCYRGMLKVRIKSSIESIFGKENCLGKEAEIEDKVISQYKILDYCKALHAEENAILNVARFGSALALRGAALYTTTYPCNMCANKIVQVGIVSIVYLEPYPMEEAKKILDKEGIAQIPFEGITFKGYFKVYGGDLL